MTVTTGEPTFADTAKSLAAADASARQTGADANQAKAARSTAAVSAIRAAWHEKMAPEDVRSALLSVDVLKGTVSKIVTILTAMQAKTITLREVKSLNGSYTLVKAVEAAGRAAGRATATAPSPEPAKSITTPEEALKLIISVVSAEKDPNKALVLAGEWITKVTNGLMAAAKESEEEEED